MALQPIDEAHALQIQAGVLGRKAGHTFEDFLAQEVNRLTYPLRVNQIGDGHVFTGDPALLLLNYIASHQQIKMIESAVAISTGALATSEEVKRWLLINGASISRCKSDLVLNIDSANRRQVTVGVSVKQCNNMRPTNPQLYFTTARGFAALLHNNGFIVSDAAISALRQFCGDPGFRPSDDLNLLKKRVVDPRRWFWEEIEPVGRAEWESLFIDHQNAITRLLFQKAYMKDPFVPDYLLHKTHKAVSWEATESAIYSIDEIVTLSHAYSGFHTRPYSIRKGSYRDPPGVSHLAPRFGIIQMQRGNQKQHPEQLQFNLATGYFYKL